MPKNNPAAYNTEEMFFSDMPTVVKKRSVARPEGPSPFPRKRMNRMKMSEILVGAPYIRNKPKPGKGS